MSTPSPWETPLRVADHPFFHGLPASLLERVASAATEHTYRAGELFFREGEIADRFFLVFHGKVALEIVAPDRPHLTIQTVGPGEIVGWSWLAPPYRWRFDARAVKTTRALALSARALLAEFEAHPDEGYRFLLKLLPVLGGRLEMARLQLLDIHGV